MTQSPPKRKIPKSYTSRCKPQTHTYYPKGVVWIKINIFLRLSFRAVCHAPTIVITPDNERAGDKRLKQQSNKAVKSQNFTIGTHITSQQPFPLQSNNIVNARKHFETIFTRKYRTKYMILDKSTKLLTLESQHYRSSRRTKRAKIPASRVSGNRISVRPRDQRMTLCF